MLAHRAGVEKIIVKLTSSGLRAACLEIGVSDIIAPTIAAAAQIQAALYGARRLDFSFITQSGLKLIELEAKHLKGKRVQDLDIPETALFVAIHRKGDVLLPKGQTRLEESDILVTLVEDEVALQKTKRELQLD
jgi:trk system potassium uptake protein TrkA